MKYTREMLRDKLIIDASTGEPVSEVELLEDRVRIIKKDGSTVEIPLNTLRGKYIKMRLEGGMGDMTGAIYV
ncbi:hypothetical protein [Thermocrinis minervae]|uniref:Uncharacterized protein n=1 Tax=Thermocrinis minervae TaxID=381751 RepID=A0A1M6QDX8_9AQUI|nr:hypothetical protein [Thermocrinis minervae]SHK18459.1 hypothetical protein SAMN05444391_0199 [Thermocrinis minervae]